MKTLYLIRQITITGSASYQSKYTDDNASQTSQTKGRFNESKQWETEVEDGCEDRGGVTSGEDCDKVTVGVVGEVVGEGEVRIRMARK